MKIGMRLVAGLAWLVCVAQAHAGFHMFRIEQLYTNADGTVQFVTMTTSFGGENSSSGVPFRATDATGTTKTFIFPNNLIGSTAGKRILIATQSFAALGLVAPDFLIPDHFVPTAGGTVGTPYSTLSYSAGQLPNDGVNAL